MILSIGTHYTCLYLSPFGMLMPGRKFSAGTGYRYGFNGKENDNEIKGEGGQHDYGLRVYDPRLGRFLSVDPLDKKFPFWSPYHSTGNNPVRFIDLDGAEILDPLTKYLMTDAATAITQKPTSAKAKVYATAIGVGGSVQGVVQGTVRLVTHPKQSAKGLLRLATNTPGQNAFDYALNMVQTYGEIPEPLQAYAIGGHFLTDMGMNAAPFKGLIKSSGFKLSADLPLGTQVAGFSFSRMGSNLVKKVNDFKLTHSIETIVNSADYKAISKLSDAELIKSVTNPKDYKMVTVNTETGTLFDGNTRIYELQKRKLNVEIPYQEYTPDNSMFPKLKEPPKK